MGIAVSNKEDNYTFKQIFKFIQDNVGSQPSHLMADAASQITAAAKDVWPDIIRLTCYFHIKQMFGRNSSFISLKKIKSEKQNAQKMIAEVGDIQTYATTNANFLKLIELWKEKWIENCSNKSEDVKAKYNLFIKYVKECSEKYVFGMYSNPKHCLTNNSLGKFYFF